MGHDARGPNRPPGGATFLPDAWWAMTLARRRQIAAVVVLVAIAVPVLVAFRAGTTGSGGRAPGDDAAAFVDALSPERIDLWDRLAACESGGDWSADTGNGFYGGVQFTLQSWRAVGGEGNPADATRDEQIMRAERLEDEQGWEAWPGCAEQLGLTGPDPP